jgi:hypothetical protein
VTEPCGGCAGRVTSTNAPPKNAARLECRRRGQLRDASARRADGFLALRLLARPFCLPAGLRCRLNSLRSAVASDLRQVASGTRGERPLAVLLAGLQGVVAAHGSA